ncbi:GTP:AMP phosphotransferase AK3, mitochondrial [Schistocerca americana]|uniref:GTP:AMP phosphotransferase AK3, mitochondrial n=1 Tax=Schistocerca americana TaxID=7009 RepID=UPI001F4F6CC6|nr:GTP:AMP phosphotransferase AK3, mitochondrial [Schistocerca americana]XP_047102836.1 GTP:AMP phosphotransferase AK3, mitochondrial [Schistocerca piceifrons]XP_049953696.1 GTP:AMP phosphotransferase AK3, mitochondrial [Schistocerca serialis cubense]
MRTQIFRAVIMGAPASGKGTISSRIVKYFEVKHLSSGDMLRTHILNNTALGVRVQGFINEGRLVPDDVMMNLVNEELKKLPNDNWLLDGFPRTRNQAELLLKNYPITCVLNLIVPFEVIVNRVKGRWIHPSSGRVYNTEYSPPKIAGIDDVTGEPLVQRADDNPETVKKRLQIYASTIEPLLELYQKTGLLQNFHGETSDEIWTQVFAYVSNFIKPKI